MGALFIVSRLLAMTCLARVEVAPGTGGIDKCRRIGAGEFRVHPSLIFSQRDTSYAGSLRASSGGLQPNLFPRCVVTNLEGVAECF